MMNSDTNLTNKIRYSKQRKRGCYYLKVGFDKSNRIEMLIFYHPSLKTPIIKNGEHEVRHDCY